MIKIPSGQQMQKIDAYTIEHEPIDSWSLMERAATAITYEITARWRNRKIVILAGPGNNGGDAMAVARLLIERDIHPETYLFNVKGRLSENCQKNRDLLCQIPNVKFQEINDNFQPPKLDDNTLVIDGLFGTGLKEALTGGFASLVRYVNQSCAEVISIDMPSGLLSEDNADVPKENIVRANTTLTFQLPKLSQIFADNQAHIGELKIIDIKLSKEAIEEFNPLATMLQTEDFKSLLRHRNPFGHKGTFGHACLIAGSYGMAGAAILAAKSCFKSGVGKVTIRSANRNNDILQISVPEAIVNHDLHGNIFSTPIETSSFNALAIGPGIGIDEVTATAFYKQIQNTTCPLVIDADGINLLGMHPDWLNKLPKNTILTPHPLELQRLSGCRKDGYSQLKAAQELSMRHQVHIVLKGHYTAIVSPNGVVHFNNSGNSGMATAGSGDALTGVLLGLLAQGYPAEESCLLGVYLHGLAGDLASKELGEEGVMASDIVAMIPKAIKEIKNL